MVQLAAQTGTAQVRVTESSGLQRTALTAARSVFARRRTMQSDKVRPGARPTTTQVKANPSKPEKGAKSEKLVTVVSEELGVLELSVE